MRVVEHHDEGAGGIGARRRFAELSWSGGGRAAGGVAHVQVELLNALRLARVLNREIINGQIGHESAVSVVDDDVHFDEIRSGAKNRRWPGLLSRGDGRGDDTCANENRGNDSAHQLERRLTAALTAAAARHPRR